MHLVFFLVKLKLFEKSIKKKKMIADYTQIQTSTLSKLQPLWILQTKKSLHGPPPGDIPWFWDNVHGLDFVPLLKSEREIQCAWASGSWMLALRGFGYLKPGIRLMTSLPSCTWGHLAFMGPNYLDGCGCDCCLFRVVTKSQLLQALKEVCFSMLIILQHDRNWHPQKALTSKE